MNRRRSPRHAEPRRVSRRAALQAGAGLGLAASAGAVTVPGLAGKASAQGAARAATPAAAAGADALPDLRAVAPLPLTGARLATFEAEVAAMLAATGVPGASIAVVQGGEVVFLQGFGVREAGEPEPVTADTLLRIGSVTKSFSSLLAATLVDADRLAWETPLAELLPGFAVADPALSARLSVADAFCACSGLPRRDVEFQWSRAAQTPESLVASLSRLELTAPYGEKFQYSNQLVAAGGFAAAVADGGAADDLGDAYAIALRERVLDPIGMDRSTLALAEVAADADYALPHAPDLDGAAVPLSLLDDDEWIVPVAPTGGLWSSAREMARYVQTELARGVAPDGGRVVSAANLERTWVPGAPLPTSPQTPALLAATNSHYALGWVVGTYGGQRFVSHTGGTNGFNSLVAFLPDADLGIVTLTNLNGAGGTFNMVVQFRLLELLFDQPPAIAALLEGVVAGQAAARADLLAHLGPIDPAAVEPFLGTFTNPVLGDLQLALRGDRLLFTLGMARSALLPHLDDAGAVDGYLLVDPPWLGVPMVAVALDPAGGEPRVVLTVQGDPGEADPVYAFERVAGMGTPTP
jgi:CubicO group peptidase (beta-lactamase class C family)